MLHIIKHNFDTLMLCATSPFDKKTIRNIYNSLAFICKQHFPSCEFNSYDITIKYVNESSSYTLDELDKFFSNSQTYSEISFSMLCLPHKLLLTFAVTPSSTFVSLESDELTKPQLEDVMEMIVKKITPLINQGKQLQPIHTNLNNDIDIMFERINTLPVVDHAGNVIDYASLSSDSCAKNLCKSDQMFNSSTDKGKSNTTCPSNNKAPFYKSNTFWVGVGSLATVGALILGIITQML